MASRSERILITGGTGFTGRPLAQRLCGEGHEVLALGYDPREPEARRFDLCKSDSITRFLVDFKPDAIVHLAGMASTQHRALDQLYSANVIGTANLFAALLHSNIRPRLIITASSAHVYEPIASDVPLDEESPVKPSTHYSVSKHAAEQIASIYSREFPVLVCRPFNYTGPGQTTDFLVPKIVQHYVERRGEIRLGNLDLYRDLSDVDRVVEAYARLITSSPRFNVVNICSGRSVYLADIISIMDDLAGYSMRVVCAPELLRKDELRRVVGSPLRLEALVGTLPNPEFRETLTRMYEQGCKEQESKKAIYR
ncbi:MAG TPA: NAD-dependent epimerase/dehydratase family protein [Candidatus Binataceae bacterium]|nr:NAD-dependent epimerase/dehydratase family protein [Candidatus Binataceae bacterium]